MVRRVVLFFGLYVVVALICSIRVPVVVTGVAYENGGARAYSNATSDYAYALIRSRMNTPRTAPPADDGPWNDYASVVPALALDTGRYVTRLGLLLIVLGTLWFGVIPHYSELRPHAWLLPLLVYAIVAI